MADNMTGIAARRNHMHLVVFESPRWSDLAPFTYTRPACFLRAGVGPLLEKQVRAVRPSRLTLWVRPTMEAMCRREAAALFGDHLRVDVNTPLDDQPATLLDGGTLVLQCLPHTVEPTVATDGAGDVTEAFSIVAPGLSSADALHRSPTWITQVLRSGTATAARARTARYAWDLLKWSGDAIVADAGNLPAAPTQAGAFHILEPANVHAGRDVHLAPGCVLDAGGGPIILGDGVHIGANAVLAGPCAIGAGSKISPLSTIRAGTSIGRFCKIGGEVSATTFLDFSNKAHEGFVGDSYVGSWVNLGAGTITSNLKNTYGEVGTRIGTTFLKTGRQFQGGLIGDHVKTAIGTRLMTGSYVGVSSMVATSGLPPTFVPSFSWLTDAGREPYRLDKAIEVMQAVYARRGRAWTAGDEAMAHAAAAMAAAHERA